MKEHDAAKDGFICRNCRSVAKLSPALSTSRIDHAKDLTVSSRGPDTAVDGHCSPVIPTEEGVVGCGSAPHASMMEMLTSLLDGLHALSDLPNRVSRLEGMLVDVAGKLNQLLSDRPVATSVKPVTLTPLATPSRRKRSAAVKANASVRAPHTHTSRRVSRPVGPLDGSASVAEALHKPTHPLIQPGVSCTKDGNKICESIAHAARVVTVPYQRIDGNDSRDCKDSPMAAVQVRDRGARRPRPLLSKGRGLRVAYGEKIACSPSPAGSPLPVARRLFVSKVRPGFSARDMLNHLISRGVQVLRVDRLKSSMKFGPKAKFSSFCISCEDLVFDLISSPDFWEANIVFREFDGPLHLLSMDHSSPEAMGSTQECVGERSSQ